MLETSDGDALIVLMHGDREVSTKGLARHLGVKSVDLPDPQKAELLTGYQVGGTSPFGIRTPLPVYVEQTILEVQGIDEPFAFLSAAPDRKIAIWLQLVDEAKVLEEPLPPRFCRPRSGGHRTQDHRARRVACGPIELARRPLAHLPGSRRKRIRRNAGSKRGKSMT